MKFARAELQELARMRALSADDRELVALRELLRQSKADAEGKGHALSAYVLEIFLETISSENREVSPQEDVFPPRSGTSRELNEREGILALLDQWSGGREQSEAWYMSFPIPALGGRTAEGLVLSGQSEAVRDYLDAVALGTFQ